MTAIRARVAAAPISWGVSEVPGWGHQMSRQRVLTEIRELGLSATEFGPDGFLPDDPSARSQLLREYGIRGIGGFVPVVLHDAALDPVRMVRRVAAEFAGAGASLLVLAAEYGREGYDGRAALDDAQWRQLLENLDRASAAADDRGVRAVLHPHMGTAVERPDDVERVLDGSGIPLCLDTGHYFVGGGSPASLAGAAARRIAHVHLKDAEPGLAGKVRQGDVGYAEGVRTGMYVRLGAGAAEIAATVGALESAGYQGWYVIEQDQRLESEPPERAGPVANVRAGLDFLGQLGSAQRDRDLGAGGGLGTPAHSGQDTLGGRP
jgi:inosose dehydratase